MLSCCYITSFFSFTYRVDFITWQFEPTAVGSLTLKTITILPNSRSASGSIVPSLTQHSRHKDRE